MDYGAINNCISKFNRVNYLKTKRLVLVGGKKNWPFHKRRKEKSEKGSTPNMIEAILSDFYPKPEFAEEPFGTDYKRETLIVSHPFKSIKELNCTLINLINQYFFSERLDAAGNEDHRHSPVSRQWLAYQNAENRYDPRTSISKIPSRKMLGKMMKVKVAPRHRRLDEEVAKKIEKSEKPA